MSPDELGDTPSGAVADAVTAMKLEPESPADEEFASTNGHIMKEEKVDFDMESNEDASPPSPLPVTGVAAGVVKMNGDHDLVASDEKSDPTPRSVLKYETDDDADADAVEEEKIGGDITVKMEPGQPPKLARTASSKVVARPPQLFLHLPDSTAAARATFETMTDCTYANKYMGYTEHAMECDCPEEWDPTIGKNRACGEDSDCINRATKIECVGDCGCGLECQNQRFQRKEYADVSVIKTEKKGFGLRAETDLHPHQFIFEYVGEVINEAQFRRRMRQYDEEGIKHFYFMSLSKGEFVDATRKGNLGRFCNHSCNPNCYVDKWVVGEKLRMGIFAERSVKAGEELVFNYNVDRYGADPQPCYCGEPNCTGFIGGRTQTDRATKLSNATIEALGIDDADGWDTAVAKRPRKKKTGEEDEEYVDSVQPKSLDENGVTKVMAALMQCKEKWIAVKLLGRIQRCEDEKVRNRVVKMHGYQILNSQLSMWKEDNNVVLQILDILDKFPRLTRNKIIDSKIEATIEPLKSCGDERVEQRAVALLDAWANLEVGYRIPRMKRDPTATNTAQAINQFERRESRRDERKRSKSRSRSRSLDAPRGPAAMTRGGHGGLGGPRHNHPPRPFRRPFNPLPAGWFAAESNGKTYYYSARGDTSWTRPTAPAPQPPPPPKPETRDKALQDIIDGIMNTKESTPKEKNATPGTPQPVTKQSTNVAWSSSGEKWRSYSEEKRKKLYENTLFPHIKYIVDRFKHKLPKDDLKRHAKDVAKKLVNSDFKNNRVEDPTKIGEKQQKKVKQFCKEYFDKAVAKQREREKKQKKSTSGTKTTTDDPNLTMEDASIGKSDGSDDEGIDVQMSDDETETERPSNKISPMAGAVESENGNGNGIASSLKRKRDASGMEEEGGDIDDSPESVAKRQRSMTPPPPPPPPPPPGDDAPDGEEELPSPSQTNDHHHRDMEDERYNGGDDNEEEDHAHTRDDPPPPPPPPLPLPEDDDMSQNGDDNQDMHVLNRAQISIEGEVR